MAGMPITRMLTIALLASLALAVPAHAQIVYDHGNEETITVANDDGSNPQTIVHNYDPSGMKGVFAPAVNPNGTTVVFQADGSVFDARAAAACGDNCQTVWQYANGTVSPVTDVMPGPCDSPCARLEQQPEIGSNGKVVSEYEWETWSYFYDGNTGYGGYWPDPDSRASLTISPHGSPVDGASTNDIATLCSGTSLSDRPQMPGISPDGTRVAYVDCTDPNNASKYMTAVEGIDGSNDYACGEDDAPIQDPSFSLDGSRIIDGESGDNPGLWSYGSNCDSSGQTPNPTYVLAAPAGWTFVSPRYAGNGRIYFDGEHQVDQNTTTGDVYSIPATCTSATCSFPGSATQITTTGDVTNVAWTSKTIPLPGSGGGSGSGTSSGSGTGSTGSSGSSGTVTNTTPTPAPNPSPGLRLLSASLSGHLATLRKGVTVALVCSARCSGTVTLTLPAALAKRLHMSRVVVLGRASFSGAANKKVRVTVHVSKANQRRLRKLKSLALTLTVAPKGGAKLVRHVTLKH
jgi:hypothetical protein